MRIKETCRICDSKELYDFLSLGHMPLPNGFLKPEQFKNEQFYPLTICLCDKCGMVQLREIIEPEIMFNEYAYYTGASPAGKQHFRKMAKCLVEKLGITSNRLVIDIGSNDGTLLSWLRLYSDCKILGIDPAKNIAEYANEHGIETWPVFFNNDVIQEIEETKGKAMVITATNVFAHVDKLHEFVDGVEYLLSDNGTFVLEVPYLLDMLHNTEFDTIYHEHLSYFSVRPLFKLFSMHNMGIVAVDELDIHGGSIRVYVRKGNRGIANDIEKLLRHEDCFADKEHALYTNFRLNTENIKSKLPEFLHKFKRVVGYGAAAKGNVLTNYCNIGTDIIEYIADTTPYKQGLYTPGMHIPVKGFNEYYANPPDGTLLLAWNYAGAILKKESSYKGSFILPIPKPTIIGEW